MLWHAINAGELILFETKKRKNTIPYFTLILICLFLVAFYSLMRLFLFNWYQVGRWWQKWVWEYQRKQCAYLIVKVQKGRRISNFGGKKIAKTQKSNKSGKILAVCNIYQFYLLSFLFQIFTTLMWIWWFVKI